MITWFALFLTAGLMVSFVGLPLWQAKNRPWQLNTPQGDEEALRQEQLAALDALRDLVLDVKLGNLEEADYQALAAPLQLRAKQTLDLQAQLRQAARTAQQGRVHQAKYETDYRIDEGLDALLEQAITSARRTNGKTRTAHGNGETDLVMAPGAVHFCPQCGQPVSTAFRFCAGCGAKLPGETKAHSTPTVDPAPIPSDPIHAAPVTAEPIVVTAPPTLDDLAAVVSPVQRSVADNQPQTAPQIQQATKSKNSTLLWRAGLAVAALWIVGVVWFYLDTRAGMANQVPVATLSSVTMRTLAVGGNLVVMGESKGIQISPDGKKWSPLPVSGDIRGLARLDSGGREWLAAGPTGLWRSTDSANSWRPVTTTPADLALITISSVPSQLGLVWGSTTSALYVSRDGGENWSEIDALLPAAPRVLAAGRTDLFLGTNRGVFRSTDGGMNWGTFSGSINGTIPSLDIQALAFDEASGMLYAGTPAGLSFQNLNSPGSWGHRSLNGSVVALALDGANNEEIWAGTAAGLLMRSRDRGVTW